MAHVYTYLTNSTERRACMLTFALTLPSKNLLTLLSPRLPITIKSKSPSPAIFNMISTGLPDFKLLSKLTPIKNTLALLRVGGLKGATSFLCYVAT